MSGIIGWGSGTDGGIGVGSGNGGFGIGSGTDGGIGVGSGSGITGGRGSCNKVNTVLSTQYDRF